MDGMAERKQRDPRVEQWLTKEGVEWHYEPDLPLNRVDREASLKNQARFKALNQDHVLELAIAAEGYDLPALVGYYNRDRRIVIISGNHRLEAYSLVGKSKSDMYIVDTAYDWVIERLTRVANMVESLLPLSRDERLNHAMHMVRTSNMPIDVAAKTMGLSGSTLRDALAGDEVRERLARHGFGDRLYPTTLSELYRIKLDSALLEAARLVHEAQLSSEETAELARRLDRVASSEKAQQSVLAQMRHEYRSRVARTRAGQVRRQILPTVKYRRAVDAINSTRPDSVRPLDKDLARRTKYAIKKLEEISQGEQSG